jgi:trehalose 6-phosphate synthase
MAASKDKPQAPLVLVSNRGPVTFDVDGSFTRGGGGLARR